MHTLLLGELWGVTWLFWWQIPLLACLLAVWLLGGTLLLWVGARLIIKAMHIGFGRAFSTNVLSTVVALMTMMLVGAAMSMLSRPFGPVAGLAVGPPIAWLIIMAMFRVSFGRAILAWLPTLPAAVASWALLIAALMPTLGRAREIAQMSICAAQLNSIGKAYVLCQTDLDRPVQSPSDLVELGLIQWRHLRCPSDRTKRPCSYFMLLPQEEVDGATIIACDYRDNHPRDGRNVLTYDGAVRKMSEAEFQAELAKPYNAAFAAALKRAEGP